MVSLLVTHVQNENVARQAVAGQQVRAAEQLEAATNVLYQNTTNIYNFGLQCTSGGHNTWADCAGQALQVFSGYTEALTAFNTDTSNVADRTAAELANQFGSQSGGMLSVRSAADAKTLFPRIVTTYVALIRRCGLLVQGG